MQQKWYSRKESSNWIDINSEGDSFMFTFKFIKSFMIEPSQNTVHPSFLSDDKTVLWF